MHFKFKYIQKIVGGFFLLTLLIIMILLVIVARGQRWFQSYTPYVTHFQNGGGLHAGSMAMIRDLEAGRVASVKLDEENRVRVNIELFRKYSDRIRSGSRAVVIKPVVGSVFLDVVLGPKENELILPGGEIPSREDGGGGLDELIGSTTKLVEELRNPGGDLMKTLENVNVATKGLADAMTKNDSTVRMLLERRDLYDELTSSMSHMNNLLAVLDESSPEIRDTITEARKGLRELNKVVRALQKSIFLRGNMERYLKEDSTLRYEGRANF